MSFAAQSSSEAFAHRARRLQTITVLWMAVEVIVALAAARRAHSPALLGFGGDSAVELLSAIVVLLRFRANPESPLAEKTAARIAGVLLLLVVVCVLLASSLTLLGYSEPQPTLLGIGLLIVAALGMPILASQKRRLADQISSPSLRADAAQSSLCGYLAWIALAGLLINATFHLPWADSVAAVLLTPIVVKEGWEAVRSSRLGCHC